MVINNDFSGVQYTIQDSPLSHGLKDIGLAVVDNDGCGEAITGPPVMVHATSPDRHPPRPPGSGPLPQPVIGSTTETEMSDTVGYVSPPPDHLTLVTNPASEETNRPVAGRRAIVGFVEDDRNLIQQVLALRRSWLYVGSADTDLVVMGPAEVLERLPDDVVKIPQRPAADDPVWRDYRFVNSIACMNAAGAEQLDSYSHILRTDVDAFITPAWNHFYPETFTFGEGGYVNDEDVAQRLRAIAAEYGLQYHGMTNIGSNWYGPTAVVRQACAFTEMLTKHIITHHFPTEEGEWPGWYRGVATMYAGDIAVNHCAPNAQESDLLDAPSTMGEPGSTWKYPHIHCQHTDEKFSKHHFMGGDYTQDDAQNLDMSVIRDYCMALSFQSLSDLATIGDNVGDVDPIPDAQQTEHRLADRFQPPASQPAEVAHDTIWSGSGLTDTDARNRLLKAAAGGALALAALGVGARKWTER
jgi:hypothetical protein